MILAGILIVVFLGNIPFGYWRENVKKFSFQWFVAVHAMVPVLVAMRQFSGLGFEWWTLTLTLPAYFGGQFVGSRLHRKWKNSGRTVSGCLVQDLRR